MPRPMGVAALALALVSSDVEGTGDPRLVSVVTGDVALTVGVLDVDLALVESAESETGGGAPNSDRPRSLRSARETAAVEGVAEVVDEAVRV